MKDSIEPVLQSPEKLDLAGKPTEEAPGETMRLPHRTEDASLVLHSVVELMCPGIRWNPSSQHDQLRDLSALRGAFIQLFSTGTDGSILRRSSKMDRAGFPKL